MNDFLTQIIIAARRRGPKGWGNILFIVFLAIVWAIGGILKAKKNAQEKKAGGQPLGPKPGGKPAEVTKKSPKGPFQQIRFAVEAELQKQREQQLKAQQAQRKIVRPQAVTRKVAAKTQRPTDISTLEPLEESKLGLRTPQVEPEIQEIPEFVVKKLEDKLFYAPTEIAQGKHLAEILLDYSDPDELKRAILHYEILGRPLSLRGPSEYIIGL